MRSSPMTSREGRFSSETSCGMGPPGVCESGVEATRGEVS